MPRSRAEIEAEIESVRAARARGGAGGATSAAQPQRTRAVIEAEIAQVRQARTTREAQETPTIDINGEVTTEPAREIASVTTRSGRRLNVAINRPEDHQRAATAARMWEARNGQGTPAERAVVTGLDGLERGMAQVTNGAFLGYGAPVTALASAGPREALFNRREGESMGEAYQRGAVQHNNRMRDQIEGGNPVIRAVNEIGGSIPTGGGLIRTARTAIAPLAARAPAAAPALERAAVYIGNAGAGAIYGSSHGDTPQERVQNAGVGAALSVPGTWAGNRLGDLISFATRGGRTADERAVRMIYTQLMNEGWTPQQITDEANRFLSQAPTEEVMGEAMGPAGQRLMRAVANVGRGSGRAQAEAALNNRATGAPAVRGANGNPGQRRVTSIRERIWEEASRMTAPNQTRGPRNYWDAITALRTARSAQGADAYHIAHNATPDPNGVGQFVLPYMRDATEGVAAAQSGVRQLGSAASRARARIAAVQTAARRNPPRTNAERQALQQQIDQLEAELNHPESGILTAQRQLQGLVDGAPPNTLNSRAIDYYQRGIGQLERAAGRGSPEAQALGESRRAFNAMSDEILPELGDARTRYGESMRIQELMDDGRRVFNMSDGEIEQLMAGNEGRGLTLEEFDGFMVGVLDAIETKLGASDTGFLARLTRNQNWRNQLERAVGGPAAARRFFNRLGRDVNMQGTRNSVLAGSRTTPLKEEIDGIIADDAELSHLSQQARAIVAAGGNVRGLLARWAGQVYDRITRPGLHTPAVQDALARRLFARATRENATAMRDALLDVQNGRATPPALRRWLDRVALVGAGSVERQGLAAIGANEPQQRWEADGAEAGLVSAYLDARRESEDGAATGETEPQTPEDYASRWREAPRREIVVPRR